MTVTFERKSDFEAYWGGPEFTRWRVTHNSFFQVPMAYAWTEVVSAGSMPSDPLAGAAPDALRSGGNAGDII